MLKYTSPLCSQRDRSPHSPRRYKEFGKEIGFLGGYVHTTFFLVMKGHTGTHKKLAGSLQLHSVIYILSCTVTISRTVKMIYDRLPYFFVSPLPECAVIPRTFQPTYWKAQLNASGELPVDKSNINHNKPYHALTFMIWKLTSTYSNCSCSWPTPF